MLKVTVVVGNPKPASRTRRVAEMLVDKLLTPGTYDVEVVDLVDHAADIFTWPSDELAELNTRVAASDLALFASPTYKATYTGLLKAFLDRYPADGLAGVAAIPILTGADETHSMGVNVNLAPLLVELGATVPGRGLYFITSRMDRIDELVSAAAEGYAARITRLCALANSLAAPAAPARPAQ